MNFVIMRRTGIPKKEWQKRSILMKKKERLKDNKDIKKRKFPQKKENHGRAIFWNCARVSELRSYGLRSAKERGRNPLYEKPFKRKKRSITTKLNKKKEK